MGFITNIDKRINQCLLNLKKKNNYTGSMSVFEKSTGLP